jgi:hypothetical protein
MFYAGIWSLSHYRAWLTQDNATGLPVPAVHIRFGFTSSHRPRACKSASNTDPWADCRYAHAIASEFVASAGSSPMPIVTPPDFHFVLLNQALRFPSAGSKLQCRFTLTSFVSSISAAKGRGCPAAWPYQSDRHSHDGFYLTDQYLAGLKH